jgi:hypothetical protein
VRRGTRGKQSVRRRNLTKLMGTGPAANELQAQLGWQDLERLWPPPVSRSDLEAGDTSNGADYFYTSNRAQ